MYSVTLHGALLAVNAFVEDTCVIVVIAYLLTRGRLFALLLETRRTAREAMLLGAVFGVIGMTEDIFPGARYPYVTETLVFTFATLVGGPRVGVVAAAITCVGDFALEPTWQAASSIPVAACCILIARFSFRFRRPLGRSSNRALFVYSAAIGMLSQAVAVGIRAEVALLTTHPFSIPHSVLSVPANGIGLFLLGLIVEEARIRRDSEQHRRDSEQHRLEAEQAHAEVEQARAMVAENQLIAVRARLHPHFLFNSLSSIAALCTIAPSQAEQAIVRLGELMRRALESDSKAPVRLSAELEDARAYMHVQQMRLGPRLHVEWRVDDQVDAAVFVPPFSILTLLENAVNHGVAAKIGSGTVTVIGRRSQRGGSEGLILIAVCDGGVGMTRMERAMALIPKDGRAHGLPLLAEQLRLLYGRPGRLRIFSQPDVGTTCAFFVPAALPQTPPAQTVTPLENKS